VPSQKVHDYLGRAPGGSQHDHLEVKASAQTRQKEGGVAAIVVRRLVDPVEEGAAEEQHSARSEHPSRFTKKRGRVLQVLKHIRGQDRVELCVGERQRAVEIDLDVHVIDRVRTSGPIDAHHVAHEIPIDAVEGDLACTQIEQTPASVFAKRLLVVPSGNVGHEPRADGHLSRVP